MNEKITLQDLVELLSIKLGITKKHADTLVRGFFDVIEEALAAEKYVKIKGLGTFKLTEVDSRESMNVNTGERIEIQGHTKISFTPDTTMKDLINKPFSHFETVVLNEGVQLEDTPFEEESKLEETIDEKVEITVQQQEVQTTVVEEDIPTRMEESSIQEIVVEEEKEVIKSVEEPIVAEEIPSENTETKEEPVEEVPVEEPESPEPVEEPIAVEEKKEEIQSEKKQSETIEEPHGQNNQRTFRVLVGIIIVLVLIILFGLYWMFMRSDGTGTSRPESIPVQESSVDVVSEEPTIKEDSVQITPDTLVTVQSETQEQITVLAENVEYTISGTITTLTLEPGQTLVKLALKYYGSKNFWPYIMQHNPDIIKDADIVPIGATIKIPKLEPKK